MRRTPYHEGKREMFLPLAIGILFVIAFTLFCHHVHGETLNKTRIVNAVIGEAESSGLIGMRCVASSIIWNRHGSLKGVYGENSKRVTQHKYSPKTFVLAIQAYEESLKHDYSDGASIWGNKSDIEIFKRRKWFKGYKFVKECGGNFFFKEVK